MSEHKQYAYRLNVAIPPECLEAGFVPEVLAEQDDYAGWGPPGPPERVFHWPRRRMYFSCNSAHRRAILLSQWGATVTIDRLLLVDPEPLGVTYVDGRTEVAGLVSQETAAVSLGSEAS